MSQAFRGKISNKHVANRAGARDDPPGRVRERTADRLGNRGATAAVPGPATGTTGPVAGTGGPVAGITGSSAGSSPVGARAAGSALPPARSASTAGSAPAGSVRTAGSAPADGSIRTAGSPPIAGSGGPAAGTGRRARDPTRHVPAEPDPGIGPAFTGRGPAAAAAIPGRHPRRRFRRRLPHWPRRLRHRPAAARRHHAPPPALPSVFRLRVSQCDSGQDGISSPTVVPCAQPHDAEVYARFRSRPRLAGERRHRHPGPPGLPARLGGYLESAVGHHCPSGIVCFSRPGAWNAGERAVVCEIRGAKREALTAQSAALASYSCLAAQIRIMGDILQGLSSVLPGGVRRISVPAPHGDAHQTGLLYAKSCSRACPPLWPTCPDPTWSSIPPTRPVSG